MRFLVVLAVAGCLGCFLASQPFRLTLTLGLASTFNCLADSIVYVKECALASMLICAHNSVCVCDCISIAIVSYSSCRSIDPFPCGVQHTNGKSDAQLRSVFPSLRIDLWAIFNLHTRIHIHTHKHRPSHRHWRCKCKHRLLIEHAIAMLKQNYFLFSFFRVSPSLLLGAGLMWLKLWNILTPQSTVCVCAWDGWPRAHSRSPFSAFNLPITLETNWIPMNLFLSLDRIQSIEWIRK